jgi:transposase
MSRAGKKKLAKHRTSSHGDRLKRGVSEGSPKRRSERKPSAGVTSLALVDGLLPDSEVSERPVRRRFSGEYKLRILGEADACSETGELGALLRREGLYSSHLSTWRRQRDAGMLSGLSPRKRGRKPREVNPLQHRLTVVERENARLIKKLQQAEFIIDFQKKVSEVLGISLKNPANESDD